MILTQEVIQQRAKEQGILGLSYSAAAQAKGRPLVEAEMIRVRELAALGRTNAEIAKEFTPPPTQHEKTTREILDAFSRQIVRLTDDMNAQGLVIRQLEEEVGKLQEEVATLKRPSAKSKAAS